MSLGAKSISFVPDVPRGVRSVFVGTSPPWKVEAVIPLRTCLVNESTRSQSISAKQYKIHASFKSSKHRNPIYPLRHQLT